jgi:hypothetical protein
MIPPLVLIGGLGSGSPPAARSLQAEASPSDTVFGIGLAPSDPLAQDPAQWRGENLLGRALAQVRDELRTQVPAHQDLLVSS